MQKVVPGDVILLAVLDGLADHLDEEVANLGGEEADAESSAEVREGEGGEGPGDVFEGARLEDAAAVVEEGGLFRGKALAFDAEGAGTWNGLWRC